MKPVLWAIVDFVFPRRLARLSYFIRLWLITIVLYWMLFNENPQPYGSPGFFHAILLVYWIAFCIIPRAKDCGLSYWLLLLLLVPGPNLFPALVLFFKRTRLDSAKVKELTEFEQVA
jgi:apolipoprotein N-acyltransferase